MIKLLILLSINARKTPLLYLEHINRGCYDYSSIRLHQVILKIDSHFVFHVFMRQKETMKY